MLSLYTKSANIRNDNMSISENKIIGKIHSTESFGSVDGPGVRFVIFMHGCAMRCKYCHNPDTWHSKSYAELTVDELLNKALRYKSYWGKNGGITVSGGEPLLQIDFVTELFKKAKEQNIHTAIDTAGQPFDFSEPFFSKFTELLKYTDLFLLDIKHIDEKEHIELTGKTNSNILDLAMYLSEIGKPVWLRYVLVPTINDSEEYLSSLSSFVKRLNNVKRFEVLPYHTLGVYKWEQAGLDYQLKNVNPPTQQELERANKILCTEDYR